MSDDAIRPAMTAEEWRKALYEYPGHPREDIRDYDSDTAGATPKAAHYLAALLLHGQPFGFTQRHAALLERMVSQLNEWEGCDVTWLEIRLDDAERRTLRELANRIAALLPPETGVAE